MDKTLIEGHSSWAVFIHVVMGTHKRGMTWDLLLSCAVKMLVTADVLCRRVVLWHWKISSSGRVAPPQLQNSAPYWTCFQTIDRKMFLLLQLLLFYYFNRKFLEFVLRKKKQFALVCSSTCSYKSSFKQMKYFLFSKYKMKFWSLDVIKYCTFYHIQL